VDSTVQLTVQSYCLDGRSICKQDFSFGKFSPWATAAGSWVPFITGPRFGTLLVCEPVEVETTETSLANKPQPEHPRRLRATEARASGTERKRDPRRLARWTAAPARRGSRSGTWCWPTSSSFYPTPPLMTSPRSPSAPKSSTP
jgi:hypothetical protein